MESFMVHEEINCWSLLFFSLEIAGDSSMGREDSLITWSSEDFLDITENANMASSIWLMRKFFLTDPIGIVRSPCTFLIPDWMEGPPNPVQVSSPPYLPSSAAAISNFNVMQDGRNYVIIMREI